MTAAYGSFGEVSECIYHMRWPARRENCSKGVGTSQHVKLNSGFFRAKLSQHDDEKEEDNHDTLAGWGNGEAR